MWVGLRYRAYSLLLSDVVPQYLYRRSRGEPSATLAQSRLLIISDLRTYGVVEAEVSGRPEGQVADHHAVRLSTVLVDHDDVGEVVVST